MIYLDEIYYYFARSYVARKIKYLDFISVYNVSL